ncbi:MAG: polysaccharide biosynthesis tyrosine autokinase [Melioribacteraceae bacterium]|nr:polysaccharide biosynthesis tyrosine autokinase [Melioribacteraceae bacterium]
MDQYSSNNFREPEVNSLKDYIQLIRLNLLPIILISLTGLFVAGIYALNATNIYKTTTVLKISKPKGGGILQAPIIQEFSDWGNDRFIANEIEILESYTLRSKVAKALLDTFALSQDEERFSLIFNKSAKENIDPSNFSKIKRKLKYYFNKVLNYISNQKEYVEKPVGPVKSISELVGLFSKKVSIEQKRGLDIVNISVESPSPKEAVLIANLYAEKYEELDLHYSRMLLVSVKEFLEGQRKDKLVELNLAEDAFKSYQAQGGVIDLSAQSKVLIDQLANFEAQKNAVKIELTISEKSLTQLKKQLDEQNPKLKDYLESLASESYLKSLQDQIAMMETKRDLAMSRNKSTSTQKQVVDDYNDKVSELRTKLDEKIEIYKAGVFASSPEEIKGLTKKVLEEEIKYQAYKSSYRELSSVVKDYEERFNQIPDRTIDLARLERKQKTLEKLYILVEEKYQEAQINIESIPGNVVIIDGAILPEHPAKPNRMLIVLVGLVLGVGMGVGFAFVKNFLDDTVKTPDDIQKKNIDVLTWIPLIEGIESGYKEFEFIVAKRPDAIPSEAFRALRTRVLYSRAVENGLKTLLVTSCAPSEGKTTITANLGASFAQAGKKTIIMDADLRKPRLHNVFRADRQPGFTDYFFGESTFEEVIRESEVPNLYFVTAGTIPPNPSEILGSEQMEAFLEKLRDNFDIVLLDSAPIIAVTDSEILSRMVDGTVLVVAANETETDLMEKSVELLRHDKGSFIGVVLNKFSYKSGYGNYYKYYYYYTRPDKKKKKS